MSAATSTSATIAASSAVTPTFSSTVETKRLRSGSAESRYSEVITSAITATIYRARQNTRVRPESEDRVNPRAEPGGGDAGRGAARGGPGRGADRGRGP